MTEQRQKQEVATASESDALTPSIREELAQYARDSSPHSPFVKLWFAYLALEARK